MDRLGWRTSRIVPARTFTGQVTQVVVGLINTTSDLQMVIRIGEEGAPAILPPGAMAELIAVARATLEEKLGEDQP